MSFSLLALLLFVELRAAQPWQFNDVERVVAISDIHGAYGAMVQTLQSAAVIDDTLSWSGGRTNLVIVGDILDRGPESRRAMELLMRLEDEAASAGGAVHVLIGNHEAMNLSGDLRYVSAAEYAAFAGDESVEERELGYSLYRAGRAPANADEGILRDQFEQTFPAGYFAHRRAFAPVGRYGQWLLAKPAIIVIDGTAFVHGGLSPLVTEQGLEGINGTLIDELARYVRAIQRLVDAGVLLATDLESEYAGQLRNFVAEGNDADVVAAVDDVLRLADSRLQAGNGPLWYRQNVYCSKLIEADRLDAALAAIGARRVVIGHTPTDGRRILERFDGRVYEVDTGMLANYYEGSGNALIIEGERVYVIGQGSTERISPAPHPRLVGRRPGAPLSAEDIAALLRGGEIITRSADSFGRTVLSLQGRDETLQAEFVKRAAAGVYPGVAAYRLDRLLQLDMVPVAVKREISGVEGTLQFAPVHWIDEQQRATASTGGTADCALPDQWAAMLIFDILQGKENRSATSIHYDASSFQVMLLDNQDAFSTSGSKPARYKEMSLKLGPAWKAALAALTDDVLQENLADVLDKRRIKALRQRRDLLLSE